MANYWDDATLNLKQGSIDKKYAAKTKKTANVPENFVSDLQKDLIELGYLKTGSDDGSFVLARKRGQTVPTARQTFLSHAQ